MKQALLLAALLLTSPVLAQTTEAKGPKDPAQALKVKCNKGWPLYRKANGLTGQARPAYINGCLAGTITPPVRVKGNPHAL